jgi:quercetin dioxygenase-like cupin family protein
MTGQKTVVHKAGAPGQAFWMLGGLYEVLLSSEESNGAATIMQMTVPAGMGPPAHTHPGTETVYVVEGTLNYNIDGEQIEAGPGSLFYIPEGTVECFQPTTTVRLLITYAPGGIDKFFAEAGEVALSREVPPPPSGPPDVERLVAIGARHGMLIQPPSGA